MTLNDFSKHTLIKLTDKILKMTEKYLKRPRSLNFKENNLNASGIFEKSKYINFEIQSELNLIKKSWTGSTEIKQGKFITSLNYEFRSNEYNIKRIRFFFDYACLLCYIMQRIYKKNRVINVVLVDYLGEKILPSTLGETLTSKHVNSGLTTFYKLENRADVLVYRREEMTKVLIHELLHAHDIDSKFISASSESIISKVFCVETLNVNEALTDAFSCVLHTILYSFCSKSDSESLFRNVENEINFIKYQAYKIIKYTNYNELCPKIIKEETNIMSYYVVKAIILSNFEEYLEFILKHKLKFRNEKIIIEFVEYKLKTFDYSLLNSWKQYENKEFLRSLRMCSYDLTNLVSGLKLYKDNSKF